MTSVVRARCGTGLGAAAYAAVALLVATLAWTQHASAQSATTTRAQRSTRSDRPLSIAATGGPGTPVGMLGLAVEFAPVTWLTLSVGGGATAGGLPQVSFMSRLRARFHHSSAGAAGFGVGFAGGPYRWSSGTLELVCVFSCGTPTVKYYRAAYWSDFELFVESTSASGVFARAYFGIQALLNPDQYECEQAGAEPPGLLGGGETPKRCDASQGSILPYLGVSLGYAFDL